MRGNHRARRERARVIRCRQSRCLYFLSLLLSSSLSTAQFNIDTARVSTNSWSPTNAAMELAFQRQWADAMKRDTLLLRLHQYVQIVDDTVTFRCRVDTVTGAGNNRVSQVTVSWASPHAYKERPSTMGYNEPYSAPSFGPLYPNAFLRTWPPVQGATGYRFQAAQVTDFSTVIADTVVKEDSVIFVGVRGPGYYYFRTKAVVPGDTTIPWYTTIPSMFCNNAMLVVFRFKGPNVAMIRPLKMVNDAERTQVMWEISYYVNPKYKYQ
jgi:hypothetical protein